ncbi:glycosyl transferase [Azospirillum soli]|uniref:glycosyl transferase n=1 Tax=Azospirillum soli TaxID=1304799 RepID=UPI001AE1E4B7|nr:glycosyl transferase [Azospirillum soli]MBP2311580.1 hypothetical protein [Azospirillum soli]
MPEQPALHFLVPACQAPEAYGPRIAEALRAAGWTVTTHALPGDYPLVDQSAILAADITVSRLPDGAAVLVDGLALPGIAAALSIDNRRLRFVALIERLLWRAPGLNADEAAARRNLEQGALALMRAVAAPNAEGVAEVTALGLAPEAVSVVSPDAGAVADLAAVLRSGPEPTVKTPA